MRMQWPKAQVVNWFCIALFILFHLWGEVSMISYCPADSMITLACVPIGLNVILPVAILTSLTCGCWTVYHRAVAIHGETEIVLPADTPHPANFGARRYPAGSQVPLWMLAHVAETERVNDEEARNPVALV
ncbi:hypothetical protein DFH09DRAFT_1310689 [Mycena vulgaris]|nr:hypothetical protein DFH09DRAFT_1310689 [Mycena vulgaris]